MAAAELGAEVEQAVAGVDLPAAKRQPIRVRWLTPGSHETAVPNPASATSRRSRSPNRPAGYEKAVTRRPSRLFELGLRALDLGPRAVVVDEQQVGVRDRVGLELERAFPVELDDLVPAQQARPAACTTGT